MANGTKAIKSFIWVQIKHCLPHEDLVFTFFLDFRIADKGTAGLHSLFPLPCLGVGWWGGGN